MAQKILIIGAGIAGLSAGVHARRNGYDAEIFEKHDLPGGLCTAWERKGYTFDGCIHYLFGTKPGSQFNRLWREVGALEDTAVINPDIFMSIEKSDGRAIHIYSDLDLLEEHLLEQAPDDEKVIRALIDAARVFSRAEFPLDKPEELYKAWDMPLLLFKMIPLFKIMGQFSRVSIAEYLGQIKDPFLKEALGLFMPSGYPMINLVSTLANLHNRDAGFPQGGSLKFVRSIEKRFLELGGRINYRRPVKEILVEEGRAAGLLFDDGSEVRGDTVIAAADLHHSVYDLLKGKYLTPLIKESFADLPTYTSVQVSLGIDGDLSGEAESVALKLDQAITLGSEQNDYIYLTNFSFDPTLAPAGKTVVRATLFSSFEYWEGVAKKRELYREKKDQVAQSVIRAVEKRFPPARGRIEVVDVATPVTFARYTGVYKGAYMAWVVPPDAGRFKIPKQLPGLENFYQIGQWVSPPAGLPGAMLTGRHVLQIICHRDKKPFRRG
jgi:phytoene dehydrogenase-like protein